MDVDGAPNAYGPPGKPTLDALMNAHYLEQGDQAIVGYLVDGEAETYPPGPERSVSRLLHFTDSFRGRSQSQRA